MDSSEVEVSRPGACREMPDDSGTIELRKYETKSLLLNLLAEEYQPTGTAIFVHPGSMGGVVVEAMAE